MLSVFERYRSVNFIPFEQLSLQSARWKAGYSVFFKGGLSTNMRRIFGYLTNKIYDQVVRPLLISVSPIEEVALGMAIGIFVGMTPTVGIQMWIVFIIWLIAKYLFRIRFDLIVGTAIVWISNPFTMFFLYYAFLSTGLAIYSVLGFKGIELSFDVFYKQFAAIVNNPDLGFFGVVWESTRFLIIDLGLPMLIGSVCYAVPFSLLSYFLTRKLLLRYRMNKAAKLNMDYEIWKEKFEKKRIKGRTIIEDDELN